MALTPKPLPSTQVLNSDPGSAGLRAVLNELEEKTRLLETTLDSISQGIFMLGADGRVSTFNQRVCELLDLPRSLLESRPTLQEITLFQLKRGDFGADASLVDPVARQYVAAAGNAETPIQYLRKTPTGRTIEVKTQTLPTGGMVRTFTDVTAYVEAEQARERLHLLLEATQSMARVGGWEVDVASGKVYWTDEVYRILDTSPEQYTPTIETTIQFFTPESAARISAAIEEAERNGTPHDLELEMITAKWRRIWVHTKSTVTMENGRAVKRTSVLQDITERKMAEEALRSSEENFRQVTSKIPGMVYRLHVAHDGSRRYSFVSSGVRELYGVEPETVMADGGSLLGFRHPDDRALVQQEIETVVRHGLPLESEFRIVLPDGTLKWVQMTSSSVSSDPLGSVRIGVMLDITARKLAETELRETEARWKLALDSTGDGVWDWNLQTGQEVFSKRFIEMYGFEEGELADMASEIDARTHPDDLEQVRADRQAHFDGLTPTYVNEHRVKCKDGSWKWILTRGMVVSRDVQGKPLRMIGTHTDITQRKQSEVMIWRQANFDALTALPNRRMLRDRLEQDIKKCRRESLQLAIMFIDLDHFKEVNDTLGHDQGDLLLVEAARRLRAAVRDSDTVARMGGDEFTVVLSELSDTDSVERIVQAVLAALAEVFQLGTEQVYVSASVGITLYPSDATDVDDLFKNADQALYAAKGTGRNRFSFFTPELQAAAQTRVRLTSDLRSALALSQFSLVYQPIMDLRSNAVHKAECLIRWDHPTRGQISPAAFIPIAETSGLIHEIGDWVFRQVTSQAVAWRSSLNAEFQISINASPIQFHQDERKNMSWATHLASMGLPGSAISIEITEGLLLDASPVVSGRLLRLRDAGVQVSLDDFGTGYSSLSYLQKFDIDYIKIDQSFVRHLVPGSTDLALCKAIIVMAHELGMKVIAEGIETAQQRDLLVAAGCDYGQGYFIARPMPAAQLEAFVTTPASAGQL